MLEISDGLAQAQTLDYFKIIFARSLLVVFFFYFKEPVKGFVVLFFFPPTETFLSIPAFATVTLANFVASSILLILWVANDSKCYSAMLCLRC